MKSTCQENKGKGITEILKKNKVRKHVDIIGL